MTIDEIMAGVDARANGRTRYAGMPTPWDEALVAEVRSLRDQIDAAERRLDDYAAREAMPVVRTDSNGRDVTDTPGLWDGGDTVVLRMTADEADAMRADHEAMEALRSGAVRSVESAYVVRGGVGKQGFSAECGMARGPMPVFPHAEAGDPADAIRAAAEEAKGASHG